VEIIKQTAHTHISPLRGKFTEHILYSLGLIFVFDVNIYSYSLRFFKYDPVVSLLLATIRQYFMASRYILF
jgi:hypothetical protein